MPVTTRSRSTPATDGAVDTAQPTTGAVKPEEAGRVGEEFFRVKNSKTRAITGTGLGMALVKRIVKSYHGSLEVESQPDQGSLFRIVIPLEAPPRAADA